MMTETTRHTPLHPWDLAILVILLEGDAHAYHIVAELERREPERRIYPANLYRRLQVMTESGFLEDLPVPEKDDGRRRRYFRVTSKGRAVAREEIERMERWVGAARQAGLLSSG
jgi:DNA-binding PadR family transcriptional regulator